MEASKPRKKMAEIVILQLMLKKWKKLVASPRSSGGRSLGLLEWTLPFSEVPSAGSSRDVPKGFLAVCVGEEMARFEFGFHQEGVLRIPCQASVFEDILNVVGGKKKGAHGYCSSEAKVVQSRHAYKPIFR
ncbi:unnamed protein product [Spirodela intermedia]|uniref:Uncharacterized protein n=1 Tax=Spirodela intermedia TaxID=51605 RepID=A0A7I8JMY6_SPIIN|nr:unnamed protein product [Spirodela intermedia]CAA6671171.1 unnamed protein product [Spirodela intermedia]